jgi:hypothetical protein
MNGKIRKAARIIDLTDDEAGVGFRADCGIVETLIIKGFRGCE